MIDGEIINETTLTKPTFEMDVEVKLPSDMPTVEHNLDKLKEYALELNNFYKSLIITENDIKEAESEKAKLNKLIDQVKRLRIDKVKEYKKPIEDFEKTAKDVESILGEASGTIKYTLDEYDVKRIEEKREKVIKPILNNIISQAFIKGYLINPANIIENPKWYNKTFKEDDIESEIQDQVDEFIKQEDELSEGIAVIESTIIMLNNPKLNKEMYIERFKYNRNITSILNDINKDNNVSHETSTVSGTIQVFDEALSKEEIEKTTNAFEVVTITFRGFKEQVNQLRDYAKQLGMEEC